MPKFAYEALDTKGRVIHGVVEAPNVQTVISDLKNIRYTVTNIQEQHDVFSIFRSIRQGLQTIDLYTLALFTRQFATIFNAGLPVMRGIDALSQQSYHRAMGPVIVAIGRDIREGAPLSKALSRHPRIFSNVYVSMIRAAEMSGAMGEVMDRLATLLEKDYRMHQKVRTAMTYPIFILIFAVLTTAGVVQYIFPKFMNLLSGLDVKLPLPTVMLMNITGAMSNIYVVGPILLLIAISIFIIIQYIKTPFGKRQWDRMLLSLPIVGMVNLKVAVSRFCRTLATLVGSGVPMMHSLDIVGQTSGNEVINDVIGEVRAGLRQGERLSDPLRDHPIIPPIVGHVIAVGEEAGNLGLMLHKLANFYDVEVEHALDSFAAMLEPLMIIILGTIVAFVLLSVFWPIYQLIGNF